MVDMAESDALDLLGETRQALEWAGLGCTFTLLRLVHRVKIISGHCEDSTLMSSAFMYLPLIEQEPVSWY